MKIKVRTGVHLTEKILYAATWLNVQAKDGQASASQPSQLRDSTRPNLGAAIFYIDQPYIAKRTSYHGISKDAVQNKLTAPLKLHYNTALLKSPSDENVASDAIPSKETSPHPQQHSTVLQNSDLVKAPAWIEHLPTHSKHKFSVVNLGQTDEVLRDFYKSSNDDKSSTAVRPKAEASKGKSVLNNPELNTIAEKIIKHELNRAKVARFGKSVSGTYEMNDPEHYNYDEERKKTMLFDKTDTITVIHMSVKRMAMVTMSRRETAECRGDFLLIVLTDLRETDSKQPENSSGKDISSIQLERSGYSEDTNTLTDWSLINNNVDEFPNGYDGLSALPMPKSSNRNHLEFTNQVTDESNVPPSIITVTTPIAPPTTHLYTYATPRSIYKLVYGIPDEKSPLPEKAAPSSAPGATPSGPLTLEYPLPRSSYIDGSVTGHGRPDCPPCAGADGNSSLPAAPASFASLTHLPPAQSLSPSSEARPSNTNPGEILEKSGDSTIPQSYTQAPTTADLTELSTTVETIKVAPAVMPFPDNQELSQELQPSIPFSPASSLAPKAPIAPTYAPAPSPVPSLATSDLYNNEESIIKEEQTTPAHTPVSQAQYQAVSHEKSLPALSPSPSLIKPVEPSYVLPTTISIETPLTSSPYITEPSPSVLGTSQQPPSYAAEYPAPAPSPPYLSPSHSLPETFATVPVPLKSSPYVAELPTPALPPPAASSYLPEPSSTILPPSVPSPYALEPSTLVPSHSLPSLPSSTAPATVIETIVPDVATEKYASHSGSYQQIPVSEKKNEVYKTAGTSSENSDTYNIEHPTLLPVPANTYSAGGNALSTPTSTSSYVPYREETKEGNFYMQVPKDKSEQSSYSNLEEDHDEQQVSILEPYKESVPSQYSSAVEPSVLGPEPPEPEPSVPEESASYEKVPSPSPSYSYSIKEQITSTSTVSTNQYPEPESSSVQGYIESVSPYVSETPIPERPKTTIGSQYINISPTQGTTEAVYPIDSSQKISYVPETPPALPQPSTYVEKTKVDASNYATLEVDNEDGPMTVIDTETHVVEQPYKNVPDTSDETLEQNNRNTKITSVVKGCCNGQLISQQGSFCTPINFNPCTPAAPQQPHYQPSIGCGACSPTCTSACVQQPVPASSSCASGSSCCVMQSPACCQPMTSLCCNHVVQSCCPPQQQQCCNAQVQSCCSQPIQSCCCSQSQVSGICSRRNKRSIAQIIGICGTKRIIR
ncbi:hypothetical protein DICVIV_11904 [Dictyocaulus viviparus]|uniref:Uncharacterized protein n=1 Tax=Dictyocaulus viviparus TaxID=29172 RepID=A0A0D8XIH7_DICVI|nr:hypothetical protein DICVIV_11904 [Dictyocaulus viviparus]